MRFATRSGQKLIFILVFGIHFSYCEYDAGSQITFETYTNKKSSDYSEYFYRNDSVAGNVSFNVTDNSALPSSSKVGFSSERLLYPFIDNPLFRQVFTSINTEERHVHHFQFNVSTLSVVSLKKVTYIYELFYHTVKLIFCNVKCFHFKVVSIPATILC